MKRQIRKGVFETNSSMTHALTICTEEEYDKWKNGELLMDNWDEKLVPADEVPDDADEYDYMTYDGYLDYNCGLEHYSKSFTTPNGDRMVAFGYYGHD